MVIKGLRVRMEEHRALEHRALQPFHVECAGSVSGGGGRGENEGGG